MLNFIFPKNLKIIESSHTSYIQLYIIKLFNSIYLGLLKPPAPPFFAFFFSFSLISSV